MNKQCTDCKETKNLNDFAKRGDRTQYRCKDCTARAMKKHYVDNKQGYIHRAQQATQQLYEEVRLLKESKPCTDCKIKYPYYVMTFDHLDSNAKLGDVARIIKNNNRKALFAEIAKCELVCFNCHAQRTHSRLNLAD